MALYLSSGPWAWRAPWKWFVRWEDFDYVVTKTFTFTPNAGNGPLWRTVRPYNGGVANRVGLDNQGVLAAEELYKHLPKKRQQKTIISMAVGPKDLWHSPVEFLHLFCKTSPPPPFFEFNISCPSIPNDIQLPLNYHPEWRRAPDPWQKLFDGCVYESSAPLILKIAADAPLLLVEKALGAGFHGVHSSNSLPVFEKRAVWGVSGPEVLSRNLAYVERLRKNFPEAHIIGGGGIYKLQDAFCYLKAGASSISLGSVCLRHPLRARIIARLLKDRLS